MFKIKDGIDLKVLEDFGFYSINDTCYEYALESFEEWGERELDISILVYKEDFMGNKKNYIYFYVYSYVNGGDYDGNEIDKTFPMDVLFELFQAGIVEKVGEENDK